MPPTQMPPTQTPSPSMPPAPKMKMVASVLVVVLLIALGYILSTKYDSPKGPTSTEEEGGDTTPIDVVVEHMPRTSGVLPVPTGFPQDIPVEKIAIVESAISTFPELNARQLTLSYQSKKTVNEKYTEYKNYMTKAGYSISEGGTGANLKAIFGTKEDVNLSVVVSKAEAGSMVQIGYLLKSLP